MIDVAAKSESSYLFSFFNLAQLQAGSFKASGHAVIASPEWWVAFLSCLVLSVIALDWDFQCPTELQARAFLSSRSSISLVIVIFVAQVCCCEACGCVLGELFMEDGACGVVAGTSGRPHPAA